MKTVLKKIGLIISMSVVICLLGFSASALDEGIQSFNSEYELTIVADRAFVGVGKTAKFKAAVEGVEVQPIVSWSCSDDSLANISSDGTLKGVKEGHVIVTASAVVAGEELSAKYPIQIVKKENDVYTYLETNNVLSLQYDYDYGYYYTNDKLSWQKTFGYARIYDYAAPYIGMEYDYIRVFFDYEGQEFMVQLWKGQYTVIYGAEIGIYNKVLESDKSDLLTFYYAADEKYWPTMDMAVYHQQKEGDKPEDYKLIFKRPVDKYWWCTGFVSGTLRECEPADELRTEATLTFKDAEMARLFAEGLEKCGFKQALQKDDMDIDSYYCQGENVTLSWQNISEAESTMDQEYNIVMMFFVKIITFLFKMGLFEFVFKKIFKL